MHGSSDKWSNEPRFGGDAMTRDFADRITWVVVADGEKAVILRNLDVDARPSLQVIDIREIDNPPAHEQAANRPGRMNDGKAGGVRKSAFEETDFHRLEKTLFARELAKRLNKAAAADAFDRLLVFAPPATLGELRAHYATDLGKRIVAEVDRDLTKHPVKEIEQHVAAALKAR
jgi:protein required for attachment to host cells